MDADLVTHDALVNTAIAASGGRVFKHTGDGAMATLEGAAAAAARAKSHSLPSAASSPNPTDLKFFPPRLEVEERDGVYVLVVRPTARPLALRLRAQQALTEHVQRVGGPSCTISYRTLATGCDRMTRGRPVGGALA